MIEISIIIPVFNAAKYLKECLEGIVEQTLKEVEIICVNDGSTDNSLKILERIKKQDKRIIIINQKNQGVSAARNAGLAIASGKYVGFVDSDDTILENFFEKLYFVAEENNCNLVFSKAFNEDHLEKNKVYNNVEIVHHILPLYFQQDTFNSVCNKLYSNAVITSNKITFPVGKKIGEDAQFNLKYLEFSTQLYYTDYSGYNYREVKGSATRNVSTQNYLENAVQLFLEEPTAFVKKNISSEKLNQLKSTRFIHYTMSLVYIYSEPKNGLSIIQKFSRLRTLVHHPTVVKVFSENKIDFLFPNFGYYQKQIWKAIQNKSVFRLYFLSLYSYIRN